VATQKTRDRFGAFVDTGWIGINNRRLAALVGVPSAESAAARAGLRSGDLVLAVGEDVDPARVGLAEGNQRETDLEDWEALRAAHGAAVAQAQSDGRSVVMWQIERQTGELGLAADPAAEPGAARPPPEILTVALPARADLESLGLMPATILVGYVSPDKPAAKAGLAAGDLVLAVDGQEIGSFGSFVSLIQTSGGRELAVTYSRAGQVDTVQLAAQEETVAGLYEIEGMEEKIFQIGLGAAVSSLPGARGYHKVRNPAESVPRAFQMAWGMTTAYLEGLGKFFTGEVGTDKLSGPIGIARIARKSLDRGWLDYLQMMMLISINLAILNLLPIPILDGGQALIYSIEGIKRSPLSLRTREMATSVGFAMLVLLMGRAFWNDLTPFWMRFVDWLSSGPQ
jgi:membrane-associated protease RseP (regulator of RpoE activity)